MNLYYRDMEQSQYGCKPIKNEQTGKWQERVSLSRRMYKDPSTGDTKYGEQDAHGYYYMRDMTDLEASIANTTVRDVLQPSEEGLYPVTLQTTDTCWTYCLKRVGFEMGISSSLIGGQHITFIPPQYRRALVIPTKAIIPADHRRTEEFFNLLPLVGITLPVDDGIKRIYVGDIQPGDLLLFSHKERQTLMPDVIQSNGNIEYTMQQVCRHIAVYEGEGKISHAVHLKSNEETIGLQIQMTELASLQYMPTHVLKLKV